MSEEGVSEEQLRNSNEPEFTDALAARGEAATHAATAPAALREHEAGVIAGARQDAAATGVAAGAGLASTRAAGVNRLLGGQQQAKSGQEGARAQVNADLRAIFDKTKTDVEAILTSIDSTVEADFTKGESDARAAFKSFHEREMAAFKEREYGWNPLAWGRDLLFGPPPGAKAVFEKSRTFYQNEMTKVISGIADTVGRLLTDAKKRVASGREQIAAHVRGLAPELRAEGAKAAQGFTAQFDQLEQSVDEKSQSVVEDLAARYVAAKGEVDAEITKMQEESKGLVGRAVAAVAGVITTIKNLAAMLTQVLARAAAAVDKIIKDPIGFLGNLVNAVKGGIQQFGTNIATHLKSGLQSWLFGALAEGGIELPEKFDFKGVLQLLLSILGLTWAKVRARIAAKLPPGALEAVEKGFTIVKTIMTVGISGIWQLLLEKLGDIKEMVLTQVKEMVSVEIIKAGIVWLISMLNPASAFVKACKMIYDVVMFFVEKASQIKEFVDSILDSVESIAGGGVGAVAGHIEKTLGRMVPVIIGFMASLLGLGGISGKIKAILEKIQEPVGKAIDWVVGKAVAFGKKALTLGKKLLAKAKDLGKKAIGGIKKKLGIKEKTPQQREALGLAAGLRVANRYAGKPIGQDALRGKLAAPRRKFELSSLEPLPVDGKWKIDAVAQRSSDESKAIVPSATELDPPKKVIIYMGPRYAASLERIDEKNRVIWYRADDEPKVARAIGISQFPELYKLNSGVVEPYDAERAKAPVILHGVFGPLIPGPHFANDVKLAAIARSGGRCAFCGRSGAGVRLDVDHAYPRSKGGLATLANAQVLCTHCNSSKRERDWPVNAPPGMAAWPPYWWKFGKV